MDRSSLIRAYITCIYHNSSDCEMGGGGGGGGGGSKDFKISLQRSYGVPIFRVNTVITIFKSSAKKTC